MKIYGAEIGEPEREIVIEPIRLPERRPVEPTQPVPEHEPAREEPLVPA